MSCVRASAALQSDLDIIFTFKLEGWSWKGLLSFCSSHTGALSSLPPGGVCCSQARIESLKSHEIWTISMSITVQLGMQSPSEFFLGALHQPTHEINAKGCKSQSAAVGSCVFRPCVFLPSQSRTPSHTSTPPPLPSFLQWSWPWSWTACTEGSATPALTRTPSWSTPKERGGWPSLISRATLLLSALALCSCSTERSINGWVASRWPLSQFHHRISLNRLPSYS